MSFQEEVIELLKKTAGDLFKIDPAALNGDTNFQDDLHCKSVDLVRITAALEDEYDVEVPFMAFKRCATFAQAAAYMSELTGIE